MNKEDVKICGLIENIKFTVMCDVDNPLTGERGATYVYGPQKGADEETVRFLDRGLRNFAEKAKNSDAPIDKELLSCYNTNS